MAETTGLEELLQKILDSHAINVERFQDELNDLRNKARFYAEHNFEEEKRITMLKSEQMEMLLLNYKNMFSEVKDALENWKL